MKRKRGNFIEHFLSVQIGQAVRDPLDALAAVFGGGVTGDKKAGGAFYRWRIHGTKAQRFLEAIAPHCLVKAAEIAAALELRSAIGPPGAKSPPGAWDRKEIAYQKWKKAKDDVAFSRRVG